MSTARRGRLKRAARRACTRFRSVSVLFKTWRRHASRLEA